MVLQAPHEAFGSSARRHRKRAAEKRYRKAKEDCTINKCGAIFQCISSVCFDAVYASDPLEDGEIDSKRERIFSKCVKKIENDLHRQKKA